MKNNDVEILIQDVNEFNAEIFFKGHMYVRDKGSKNASYFAPYFTGKEREKKGISYISEILYTEEIEVPINPINEEKIKDYFSFKFKTKEPKNWKYWENGLDLTFKRSDTSLACFYFLDEPIKLIELPISKDEINNCSSKGSIKKGLSPMIPKNYSLKFSDFFKIYNARAI